MLTASKLIKQGEKIIQLREKTRERQREFIKNNLNMLLREHSKEYIVMIDNSRPEFYWNERIAYSEVSNVPISVPVYYGKICKKTVRELERPIISIGINYYPNLRKCRFLMPD